jgi:MerR family transcriptional regulator, copper efflux regulator
MPHREDSAVKSASLLQIGEVADRVGLSLRTVRYYEEQGLLTPETRSTGGFRLYSEDQIDRLAVIKQMKPLGFTVQEMRELLDARDALRGAAGDDARHRAEAKLSEYAEAAAERCAKLREQMRQAEGLASQLRREARGESAAPPASV